MKNSYPLKGEVYIGRQRGETKRESKARNKPQELVLRLLGPYLNTGRNVTMDNWFTRLELTEDLLRRQTTVVGTLRKNKRKLFGLLALSFARS